jgi:hypothetical protein
MNRNIAVVTVVAVACALGAQAAAPPPQPQTSSAVVQPFPGPSLYTYQKSVPPPEGCVVASANPATRKVWAARLGCAQQVESAGLELVGLKPDKPMPGVKISATFEVTQMLGGWWLAVTLHRGTGVTELTGQTQISHTGTYTVVSSFPSTLDAGLASGAMAYAYAEPSCGDACAIALTIKEIKWLFP